MKKLSLPQVLAAVLLLQLLVAGLLKWQSHSYASFEAKDNFLELDQATVTRLVLSDGEQTVSVVRDSGTWQLPDHQSLPADKTKVDALLGVVTDLRPGLPVANRSSSHAQLNVTSDDFQRHVQLFTGDTAVASFYVGTSPGFRKAHIRRADDERTFAGKLNVYELPVNPNDWLDKSLIAFSDLTRIRGEGFELEHSDDKWQLLNPPAATAETHQLDEALVEKTVNTLEQLRVTGMVDVSGDDEVVEAEAETSDDEPQSLSLTLTVKDKEIVFSLEKENNKVTGSRDDIPETFELGAQVFDSIAELSSDALWVAKE